MAEGEGKADTEEKAEEKPEGKKADEEKPAEGEEAKPDSAKAAGDKAPQMQFASLYVGDLHPDVAEALLYEAFQSAGKVASCRVCRDSVTRKSLCYGYVNYYTVEDAEKALETLNYMSIKGKPCRIMWSQRDAAKRKNTNSNIFVKGLDPTIDNKALHDTFSVFGNILSCKVSIDSSGKSRGYGFVHYEAEEAAQQAITRVNGMRVGDNIVFVGPFKAREEESKETDEVFTNLYIKNMPDEWDDDKVQKVFGDFGEVLSSVVMKTDDGKKFALVNFKESAAAKTAVEKMHKKDMRSEEAKKESEAAEAKAEEPSKSEGQEAKEGAEGEEAKDAPAAEASKGKKGKDDDHPDYLLYVQRAQTKAERQAMLTERKSKKGAGKGAKQQGVRLCVRNLGEATTEESLRAIFEPYGSIQHVIVRTDDETGKCKGVGFVVLSSTDEATKAISETHLRMVDGKPLNVGLAERREQRKDKGDREDSGKGRGGKGRGRGGKAAPPPPVPGAPHAAIPPPLPPYPGMPLGGLPYGSMPGLPPGWPGSPGRPPMPGYALPPGARAPLPGAYALPPAVAGAMPGQPAPHAGGTAASLGLYGRPPGAPHTVLPPVIPSLQSPLPPMMPPMQAGVPQLPGAFPPPALPPLTNEQLAALPAQAQKQQLGERLFALSCRYRPDIAGKVTGMMLELDNTEILTLISDEARLRRKIDEAVGVLQKQAAASPPSPTGGMAPK